MKLLMLKGSSKYFWDAFLEYKEIVDTVNRTEFGGEISILGRLLKRYWDVSDIMSPISAYPLSKEPFNAKALSHYKKEFLNVTKNLCSTILNAPIQVFNKRNPAGDSKIHIILKVNIL